MYMHTLPTVDTKTNMHIYIYMYTYVCVCGQMSIHLYLCVYIYIYIYMRGVLNLPYFWRTFTPNTIKNANQVGRQ